MADDRVRPVTVERGCSHAVPTLVALTHVVAVPVGAAWCSPSVADVSESASVVLPPQLSARVNWNCQLVLWNVAVLVLLVVVLTHWA